MMVYHIGISRVKAYLILTTGAEREQHLNLRRERTTRWIGGLCSQKTQCPHHRAPLGLSLFLSFLAHLSSGNLVPIP
jgi:hypothetical protein